MRLTRLECMLSVIRLTMPGRANMLAVADRKSTHRIASITGPTWRRVSQHKRTLTPSILKSGSFQALPMCTTRGVSPGFVPRSPTTSYGPCPKLRHRNIARPSVLASLGCRCSLCRPVHRRTICSSRIPPGAETTTHRSASVRHTHPLTPACARDRMTTDVLQEPEVCFICLESEAAGPLHSPCACPRKVHPYCLARWQLQCAGKEEEKHCRFCKHNLPCWKDAFANDDVTDAVPVMSIHFNNSTYWLKVHQGQEGLARFKADIRQLLGLAEHMHFDITFECKVPGADGGRMELRGLDAFDAAVYCASLTAAERRKARRRSSSRDKHSPTSTSSHSNSSGSSSSSSVASAGDGEADSDPTTPLGLAQSRGRGPAGEAPDIDWMTNNSRSNRSRDSWASGTGGGSAAGGVAAGTTGSGARRGGRRSSNGSSSGSDAGGGGEPGRLGWKQLSKLFAFLKKQPSSSSRTSISSRSGSTMSESYSVDAFSSSGRRTGRISSSNSIASVASSADGVTQVVTPGATPLVRRAGGGDLPLLTAKAKQLLPGRLLKRLRAALVRALP